MVCCGHHPLHREAGAGLEPGRRGRARRQPQSVEAAPVARWWRPALAVAGVVCLAGIQPGASLSAPRLRPEGVRGRSVGPGWVGSARGPPGVTTGRPSCHRTGPRPGVVLSSPLGSWPGPNGVAHSSFTFGVRRRRRRGPACGPAGPSPTLVPAPLARCQDEQVPVGSILRVPLLHALQPLQDRGGPKAKEPNQGRQQPDRGRRPVDGHPDLVVGKASWRGRNSMKAGRTWRRRCWSGKIQAMTGSSWKADASAWASWGHRSGLLCESTTQSP